MNLSMKWLADYVTIDTTPKQYAHALTMSGSKVEGYTVEGAEISNVVVGKIVSVDKHPDADKLVVCQVKVGQDAPVQIVTGAPNIQKGVSEGALVPVALHNSMLPGGKNIKKGKLRGVESQGMLCSLGELGLTIHDFPYAIEDGIFVLEEDCHVGQPICEAIGLNDTCVEFEITSNRPDCMSVTGLARETAATYNVPLNLHTPAVKGQGGKIGDLLQVSVENQDLCKAYLARVVKNVKIEPSPRWMRERLRASGVRPINNIVDITNYVMLEYGQPMHAFDLKYVEGGKIVVRNAKAGETIVTLDGIERTLSPEMLVIADAKKPVAVAGVMGGEYSGIMDDTTTVVFESANFLGTSVRTTAKKLGMRTEASSRYEKGLDPHITFEAVQRACELVEMLNAGDVCEDTIACEHYDKALKTVRFEPDWTNEFLGVHIPREQMVEYLGRLGFAVSGDIITVPSFRTDIEHKADIAEEIARMYGYDNIPITAAKGAAQGKLTEKQKFERRVNEAMLSMGCYEIMTYSFISPKYYDNIRLDKNSPKRDSIRILNPLGEDTSIMRTTAIPSMLESLSRNFSNRNLDASLFELASEYIKTGEDTLPNEYKTVTIGLYGQGKDFYTLKGMVESLLKAVDVAQFDIVPVKDDPTFHPGRCARLSVGGEDLGVIGEIHPAVCETYGISAKVYVANLYFDVLFNHHLTQKQYKPLPKHPAVTRDLALLCDASQPVHELEKAIQKAAGKLLEEIVLFDVYQGKQIEEGKKSVAYSIVLRAEDRTLNDQDVEHVMNKILKALESMQVTLRS